MSKITSAAIWSGVGLVLKLGLKFGVSIILAKKLSPVEFGLMGKLTVLITILHTIGNLGFTTALIQRKDTGDIDNSSVFWINIITGAGLSVALFSGAPLIASFYHSPELMPLSKALSVVMILNSLILVPQANLAKHFKFKQLELYDIGATIFSSALALYFAFKGSGVWSLVIQVVTFHIFLVLLYWIFDPWRPSLSFSRNSIQRLAGFGSNMFGTNLINFVFANVDSIVIGKYYPSAIMGYYSYSQMLIKSSANVLVGPVFKILFPMLSSLQHDLSKMKAAYKKAIDLINFVMFPAMTFVILMADSIAKIFLNEKWMGISPFLRYFALISIISNVCAINVNILSAAGKGQLVFWLEVLKKSFLMLCILIGFRFGIQGIMGSIIFYWISAVILNMYFSGQVSGYSWLAQIKDLSSIFIVTLVYSVSLYYLSKIFGERANSLLGLISLGGISLLIYIFISSLLRLEALQHFFTVFEGLYKSRFNTERTRE